MAFIKLYVGHGEDWDIFCDLPLSIQRSGYDYFGVWARSKGIESKVHPRLSGDIRGVQLEIPEILAFFNDFYMHNLERLKRLEKEQPVNSISDEVNTLVSFSNHLKQILADNDVYQLITDYDDTAWDCAEALEYAGDMGYSSSEWADICRQEWLRFRKINCIRGSMVGGAIGDALGYSVEFMSIAQIKDHYGDDGITHYELVDGKALISDDTQMTLFTATGLLHGETRLRLRGISAGARNYVNLHYKAWMKTQDPHFDYKRRDSWLLEVSELHNRRAPGNTCLSALSSSENGGTIENPINNSKGCGGLMRIAPVGLFFSPDDMDREAISSTAAEIAALTHGHELGYIPAATLAAIVNSNVYEIDKTLLEAIEDALALIEDAFPNAIHTAEFLALIREAIELAAGKLSDLECIESLGEGWTAEETLAIAIFCSLRHQDSFKEAIIAAVNHSGDSDSTGSVTGNILGASCGYSNLPLRYLNDLELKDVILEIADDLARGHDFDESNTPEGSEWERFFNHYAR